MSRSIPTEDRISSLPDSILYHILSFLPTKSAAATTILSKRWNPLWLSIPTLHFDDKEFKDSISFCRFISSVFLLRNIMLPLQSFNLKISKHPYGYGNNQHDISQFVHAAVQREGIENFNLDISIPGMLFKSFKLPPSIFSCKTLVVLHLTGVKVNPTLFDLPRLKTLHLSSLGVPFFSKLLSGCPILEKLHATLDMTNSNTSCNQFLIYHNLTNMELILQNYSVKWKWIIEMLRHCPKLQNLTIHEDPRYIKIVADKWMNPPIVPECLSTQLKTCLLKVYIYTECWIQFAKYIMQNSKVLNTMSITVLNTVSVTASPFAEINAKHNMLKKLALSRRASATCELKFD